MVSKTTPEAATRPESRAPRQTYHHIRASQPLGDPGSIPTGPKPRCYRGHHPLQQKSLSMAGKTPRKGRQVILSTPPGGVSDRTRTELPPALIKADTTRLTLTADKSTGKIRVQANQFDETRVIEPGRQLAIRYIQGQVNVFDVAAD